MYYIYKALTHVSEPFLHHLLNKRLKNGKEQHDRFEEKKAIIRKQRPKGKMVWIHAASVGESQSALIIINKIIKGYPDVHVLVTTGTVTSASLMKQKLPDRATHQFAPLDHPKWVSKFLDHWKPDLALWMESELWPNMLHEIKSRKIPALLLNAHMSDKSYKAWKRTPLMPKQVLGAFNQILCQTVEDKIRYDTLGAKEAFVTDNLKYSAEPLTYNQEVLTDLQKATRGRPLWLYASSHKGEEQLACDAHLELQKSYPNLLTIIVPRHPERREEIRDICQALQTTFRGENKELPCNNDQIYIADTLGELGVFYKLCPIAVIGRSFSDDGGGGHNPIEAAQLGCAVLHGPNVQNLQEIFDDMNEQNACTHLSCKEDLTKEILTLLRDRKKLESCQNAAKEFSQRKTSVINKVMAYIEPNLSKL